MLSMLGSHCRVTRHRINLRPSGSDVVPNFRDTLNLPIVIDGQRPQMSCLFSINVAVSDPRAGAPLRPCDGQSQCR